MSEHVSGAVSAGTGTITVLTPQPAGATVAARGKPAPDSGKPLPLETERARLNAVVEQLNKASRAIGRDLRFEVNLDSGHSVIQVLDRETGEIIRQIPPEEATTYLHASGDLAVRLFDGLA